MLKKRVVGAMDYRHGQEPFKYRNVLFSNWDGKFLYYQLVWTPIFMNRQIVWDLYAKQYVFANTSGWYPTKDSFGNIMSHSVFVLPDDFDLSAANIIWHCPPKVSWTKSILYPQ